MRRLTAVLLAVLTVLAVAGVAYGDDERGRGGDRDDAEFTADLRGRNEVPPVETRTRGEASFEFDRRGLEFELEIRRADGVFGAAGAHIHCAPEGQNGPVVVFLAGQVPGGLNGDVEVEGTLTDANIVNPACGATLGELAQAMRDGRTYVNVHSTAHPSGVVRGQIEAD